MTYPEGLDGFVALVLGDAPLQARLAAEIEEGRFIAVALDAAAAAGLALDADTLAAQLRLNASGRAATGGAPLALDSWPPAGWLPAKVAETGALPALDWLWFGPDALEQPFFEDAVRRASALPFNRVFRVRTSLAALVAGAAVEPALPLAGLIHHMSRCGSTLVARLLMALPGNRVVSEPAAFDAVLRWAHAADAPLPDRIAALQAMASALGRRRGDGRERLFIKLDSWHTLALPLVRAAFAATPWVFLHRNPAEILASHGKMPGMQAVPGLLPETLTGIADPSRFLPEDYLAQILGRICEAAADGLASGGIAVDYADLSGGGFERIARHFGVIPDARGRAAMEPVWAADAKHPEGPFVASLAHRNEPPSAATRALADRHVTPARHRLHSA